MFKVSQVLDLVRAAVLHFSFFTEAGSRKLLMDLLTLHSLRCPKHTETADPPGCRGTDRTGFMSLGL